MKYFGDSITGTRQGIAKAILRKLDQIAARREAELKSHRTLDRDVQAKKKIYKKSPTKKNLDILEEAREKRRPVASIMNKISEKFGEAAAEVGVRDIFNGKTEIVHKEKLLGKDGEPVLKNGKEVEVETKKTLPELAESTPDNPNPIPPSENAPKNGNDQFDQIWRTKDGGFVIVEAKSSLDTPLGERTVKGDKSGPKRVQQGSREYMFDTIKKMEKRKGPDKVIAEELLEALREDKVNYLEARGNPREGKYEGNSLMLFDIRKNTEGSNNV